VKEFAPASFCPPPWPRCRDAEFGLLGCLAALLQGCSASRTSSPAEARRFHTGLLYTKEKGKYKAFPCVRLGLAMCCLFCSFLLFSCGTLREEAKRGFWVFQGSFLRINGNVASN